MSCQESQYDPNSESNELYCTTQAANGGCHGNDNSSRGTKSRIQSLRVRSRGISRDDRQSVVYSRREETRLRSHRQACGFARSGGCRLLARRRRAQSRAVRLARFPTDAGTLKAVVRRSKSPQFSKAASPPTETNQDAICRRLADRGEPTPPRAAPA